MENINHHKANSEFQFLYSTIQDNFYALDAFLKHIHEFVYKTEEKIGPDLELYSLDFFEYYYAASYVDTFRSSFIVTVTSASEKHLRAFIRLWAMLFHYDISKLKSNGGLLDQLRFADKSLIELGLDFSHPAIANFKGLLAIRNSLVHSDGNMEYVSKYKNLIKEMTQKYSSIELTEEGELLIEEEFCKESMMIARRFFFHLFKLSIRRFPNYRMDSFNEDEL